MSHHHEHHKSSPESLRDFVIGMSDGLTVPFALAARFVTPDEFEYYKRQAYAKGFLMVASSPLTRSSYHAGDDFAEMKRERDNRLKK